MSNCDYKISSDKTKNDWLQFVKLLIIGGPVATWQDALNLFFKPRLKTRYLIPVKILKQKGSRIGEGFAIMTILCSMVEFLESTYQGKVYHYPKRGEQLNANEYKYSSEMFKSFLVNRLPFSNCFNEQIAEDFYTNVRCGLLHEAATKGGWLIRANASSKIIDYKNKIIYRNQFEDAINQYIKIYENEILASKVLQKNFIRKMDNL